jgi:hypothetical protein
MTSEVEVKGRLSRQRLIALRIALLVLSAELVCPTRGPLLAGQREPTVRLWDTGKTYTQKLPMADAWKDKANWAPVPYGMTDYQARGDLMLEGETFYLFLFTNKDDSVDLMAKMGDKNFKLNEIYKVHQDEKGLRNFGMGTMAGGVKILKNTAGEIVVEHAGEGKRDGKPILTIYRALAGKPWLEVRPVEHVNQQGMHGKSRICAFAKREGEDFILDSKREPFAGEVNLPAPEGTVGIINFSRGYRGDYDFMWFLTFPPGAEKHPLTYLGFHADPFWEDPPRPDRPSVGAQYAYLDKGGVMIGVLNNKDNWKREDVGRPIKEREIYTTQFKAPYPGQWKLAARLSGKMEVNEASNLVKDPGAEGEASVLLRGCRFPQGWGCYEGAGTAAWGVTTEEAHGGRKSVYMKITGHDQRPITNNALTLGATEGYSGAEAFDARPNATYQFSFWIKGKGFKRPLSVYAQGWKEPIDQATSRQKFLSTLGPVLPTEQWQQCQGSFTTAADTRKVALFLMAYGKPSEVPVGATIWVDDVLLTPATAQSAGRYVQSRATISQAGEPFRFRSPADGTLDYILVYLWDRTDQTPSGLWTPMAVYREAVENPRK